MIQGVKVIYYDKPVMRDPKTGEAKEYIKDYTFELGEDWKLRMIRELKIILDKYRDIKEVRFYVP